MDQPYSFMGKSLKALGNNKSEVINVTIATSMAISVPLPIAILPIGTCQRLRVINAIAYHSYDSSFSL